MQKLEWMPLYIDSLLSSPAWLDMRDYQRGWYVQLLLRSTRSERLGYLPLDGQLWKLAGAHSRDFWDTHKPAVMACFKVIQFDGRDWIYNPKLLSVMEEQSGKYYRKRPPSLISPVVSEVDLGKDAQKIENVCKRHPESGRTQWGACWSCYEERVESRGMESPKSMGKAATR